MKLNHRRTFITAGLFVAVAGLVGCGEGRGTSGVESKQDDLFVLNTALWPVSPIYGYPAAPVCFEQTGSWTTEKEWFRDSIADTWQIESQVGLPIVGLCGQSTKGLRVQLTDGGPSETTGLGVNLDGHTPGMWLNTRIDTTASCPMGWSRERCFRSAVVHETGHALGFAHEQNRPDTPSWCLPCTMTSQCASGQSCTGGRCRPNGDADGNQTLGPWDQDSVMNYCNPVLAGDGHLSGGDIAGLVSMYGHPTPVSSTPIGNGGVATVIRGTGNALFASTGGTYANLGGVLTSAPTVVSWGSDRLDAFARGSDGAVWSISWTSATGWGGWNTLGGFTKGKPKAIARAQNRLDVFARGGDDALWVDSWNGSAWSGWSSLGNDVVGDPSITSWGANRVDVVVRGRDSILYHIARDGTVWGEWETLGGGDLTSSPSSVSWGVDRLDIVVVRADQGLWHTAWNGLNWSGLEPLGGVVLGNPRIISRASNLLDVVVRGSDNAVWTRSWNGSNWTGWGTAGLTVKGSPEAVALSSTAFQVLVQNKDDSVWRIRWENGWAQWARAGGLVQ